MSLRVCRFPVVAGWKPFLTFLNWQPESESVWSDGWSHVHIVDDCQDCNWYGFDVLDQSVVPARQYLPEHAEERPYGVTVRFHTVAKFNIHCLEVPRYCLNHVALDVPDVELERNWIEGLLGPCTVLARESVWEPVLSRNVEDCHLFRPPDFYITLRKTSASSGVNHIGWMAKDREAVNEASSIAQTLKWPIVFGPQEIDGSYLVHFRGPDQRVHDVFFPLPEIQGKAM